MHSCTVRVRHACKHKAWHLPCLSSISLHSHIPLHCCLSFGQLSDYCVGMDCEQWTHSSFEFALVNLQRPIWLSPPISHTAYRPFAPRIEKVRGGDGEPHLSAKQWPPPSEPWRHTWMPDGKANYVFFGVDLGSHREHLFTTGDHETAHGSSIPRFGMKCVEAQPCSVGPMSQYS